VTDDRLQQRIGDCELALSRCAEHTEREVGGRRGHAPFDGRCLPLVVVGDDALDGAARDVAEDVSTSSKSSISGAVSGAVMPSRTPSSVSAAAAASARSACAVQDTGPSCGTTSRTVSSAAPM
jgi:hypothetical protein